MSPAIMCDAIQPPGLIPMPPAVCRLSFQPMDQSQGALEAPGLHRAHLQAARVRPSSRQTDTLTDGTPAAALTSEELQLCGERLSFQICAMKRLKSLCRQRRHNRKEGRDTVIFFNRTNNMITSRGEEKLNLKENRLYTIADNVTITDRFSYFLSACINTIFYNGSNICNIDISITQNPLMQFNAR